MSSKVIRIHVYFGPTNCRTLVLDKSLPYKENFFSILRSLGITSEPDKYMLKLVNGELVESNDSITNDDRILIIPLVEVISQA